MRSAYAQQKDYFDFGVRERLRAFLDPTFTAGVVVAVKVLLSAVAVKEKLPYKTKKTAIKSCLSCGASSDTELFKKHRSTIRFQGHRIATCLYRTPMGSRV